LNPVKKFYKFENPTPAETPATINEPTVIYPCVYLRNDHTDSCYRKVTPVPGPVFTNFWLRVGIRKKNA